MGKASRDKGARRELEIVARHLDIGVHAVKVSGMYKAGHDIEVFPTWLPDLTLSGEVKARGNGGGFTTIERWLGDNDALFLVRDRQEPLVVLSWAVWAQIIGGGNG